VVARPDGRSSRGAVVARGPVLVLREPMALPAVAGAALVLVLAVAGGPLFVSADGRSAPHPPGRNTARTQPSSLSLNIR
jgi:hypothetical protein